MHPRPSRLPACTSPARIACPPLDSAARVGLQPAAELGHLQRHDHALHVLRALSARALGPQALSRATSTCMPLVVPPPHHTGPPASRLAPLPPRIACPPLDSAGRVSLQPAAELRHLQRHDHEQHVLCALSARALGPQALSRAPCMPTLPPRTLSPASRLAPRPPLYTHTPFDSGRTQTPCPLPTSYSSAARGWAPRPSTAKLASARAPGLRRKAAPHEVRLHPFVRDRGGDQGKEERTSWGRTCQSTQTPQKRPRSPPPRRRQERVRD